MEREGLENALTVSHISNLRICRTMRSPGIPFDPPIWQWETSTQFI